jgi:hypothetical protein
MIQIIETCPYGVQVSMVNEDSLFSRGNSLYHKENDIYYMCNTYSSKYTGDVANNRFKVTINGNKITFNRIKEEGKYPTFKCHSRIDGKTFDYTEY